jgi:hypothetical protein
MRWCCAPRRLGALALIVMLSSFVLVAVPAGGQVVEDPFAIGYGDTVSDGVPDAGAGNIEAGGGEDAYAFAAAAGDEAIFDVLTGDAGRLRMRLESPGGAVVFDGLYVDRVEMLPETGTYIVRVRGAGSADTGPYSFRLLRTPPPEPFVISIGDAVSVDDPGPGAGAIESPGATDVYTFDAAAGQGIVLDLVSGSNTSIAWRLEAPDTTELFATVVGDRQDELPLTGTYTLTLSGLGIDDIGPYAFQILDVPAAQAFTIGMGDTVSLDDPGPGAGNIESPGAVDQYRFDATAGQTVVADALTGRNTEIRWSMTAPDGSTVFDTVYGDQQVTVTGTGTHTLLVRGLQATRTGAYSFRVFALAPDVDEFTIALGDTVSLDSPGPGAGNIESAGALDRYRFDAAAGQTLLADTITGSNNDIRWSMTAPDGSSVFDDFYVDRAVTLTQTGTHTLVVQGLQLTSTGTYSFSLADDPNVAPVHLAATLLPAPAASAGDGHADVEIDLAADELCSQLAWKGLTPPPATARIGAGAAGVDGPTVVDLVVDHERHCIALDHATLAALVADPAGFFVELSTDQSSGDVIRGQLDLAIVYTARFDAGTCETLDRIVVGLQLGTTAHLIRMGVDGWRGVVDSGGASAIVAPPPNAGPCVVDVAWPASAHGAISGAASAWGVDEHELHHLGGEIVIVLLWLGLLQANGVA